WYQLIMKALKLNPDVMTQLMKTFLVDANLLAWPVQERNRQALKCNIPWAILLDPTSACNLNCTGCWAADYGHSVSLTYDEIDSIINQGTQLGTHVYIYTGGEPLVRKKDLIRLCEVHQDCVFLSFTNSTLIDEEFCEEMARVKNFVPAISVEGIGEATDVRRGQGTFAKIDRAMSLLREHRLPFGVSCCHTSQNAESIASEEFFDWLIDKGALFAWIFTFMPVGVNASSDLMATPEQREHLYHFVREMRDKKALFTLDFQNDGEFVGGCVAGGRRYLHINAAGDVEPCVFAHYSNANIREVSLLDALRSPLFMQYYHNMPFDGNNLLRPCPIYENTGKLADMVEAAGAHSTDLEHEEDPRALGEKFAARAIEWEPVAKRLWYDGADPRAAMRARRYVGMAESDIAKFEEAGNVSGISLQERDAEVAKIQENMA
ncbi:MAG: radical SAM protein, partial [Eggerthellaceae bacterium]|nr:radical SAM protein [Eggerthellaceae bacterium]